MASSSAASIGDVDDVSGKTSKAVADLCLQLVPCVQSALETWHTAQKHNQQACLQPSICRTKGKPTFIKGSCQSCISWGVAVEKEFFPNSNLHNIQWQNVNPTRLHEDPMEVAKAFVLRLPSHVRVTTCTDFDSASLLKFMMSFGAFHQHQHCHYNTIYKVYSIRNRLSHMSLHVGEPPDLTNACLEIKDFIRCLETLRHLTREQADDIRSKVNMILSNSKSPYVAEHSYQPHIASVRHDSKSTGQTLACQFQDDISDGMGTVEEKLDQLNLHAQQLFQDPISTDIIASDSQGNLGSIGTDVSYQSGVHHTNISSSITVHGDLTLFKGGQNIVHGDQFNTPQLTSGTPRGNHDTDTTLDLAAIKRQLMDEYRET
ncbi:uncharacterized protein [Amphiura filiformis]|uniref:uncharacterized protein n=1 Tax=Amphiura filiformis TaxID=82378 RepID=UPI003B21A0B1